MPRKETSTDEIKLDDVTLDLDTGSPVEKIEVPKHEELSNLADREKFYNERLTVYFAEPANETESPFVEITVNGRYFCWRRGEQGIVPRYVLEWLARSKVQRVRTERRVGPDGSEESVVRTSTSPSYPFSVLNDPSGARGAEWLKKILAAPI